MRLEEAGNTGCVGGNELAGVISRRKVAVAVKTGMLSKVIVIVGGRERQDKCVCAMCVSGEGVGSAGHVVAASAVTDVAC